MSTPLQIGPFTVEYSDPYPVWISVKTDQGEIRFSHKELRDLQYAVNRTMRDVKCRLNVGDLRSGTRASEEV